MKEKIIRELKLSSVNYEYFKIKDRDISNKKIQHELGLLSKGQLKYAIVKFQKNEFTANFSRIKVYNEFKKLQDNNIKPPSYTFGSDGIYLIPLKPLIKFCNIFIDYKIFLFCKKKCAINAPILTKDTVEELFQELIKQSSITKTIFQYSLFSAMTYPEQYEAFFVKVNKAITKSIMNSNLFEYFIYYSIKTNLTNDKLQNINPFISSDSLAVICINHVRGDDNTFKIQNLIKRFLQASSNYVFISPYKAKPETANNEIHSSNASSNVEPIEISLNVVLHGVYPQEGSQGASLL